MAGNSLTHDEEDGWFSERSEWRQHHALRRAALDVALPNVVIRRLADGLEVSWDNERWGSPRPGLQFVERRGTAVVPAQPAAQALFDAIGEVTAQLYDGAPTPSARPAKGSDWRRLVHRTTAELIRTQLPKLDNRLSRRAKKVATGFFVPHTPETLILRQARPTRAADVSALLELPSEVGAEPLTGAFAAAINPTSPSVIEPWLEGYERAGDFRERMGWGNEPLPVLDRWLSRNHTTTRTRTLPGSVDVVSVRTEDWRAGIFRNRGASPLRKEMAWATGLGRILMDPEAVTIDGAAAFWPSAARARAFAVMLALPDEGVRVRLARHKQVDADAVRDVMGHFRAGPFATTHHLKNRKFISEDQRVTLLAEITAGS